MNEFQEGGKGEGMKARDCVITSGCSSFFCKQGRYVEEIDDREQDGIAWFILSCFRALPSRPYKSVV